MLIDTDKYYPELRELWYKTFGDDREYIDLLFRKGYKPALCFGETDKGALVSAFYLLGCSIKCEGSTFKGMYLYAAATHKEHRSRGIMGRLIKEAQEYMGLNNIDFIALVPATEWLYDYYARYGFTASMYNYRFVCHNSRTDFTQDEEIKDREKILSIRNKLSDNRLQLDKEEMSYAFSCLDFTGYRAYLNSSDSYYIYNKENNEVLEYISSEENLSSNTRLLLSKLEAGTEIYTPHSIASHLCQKNKFGMIYTENTVLKKYFNEGIYMNIALD